MALDGGPGVDAEGEGGVEQHAAHPTHRLLLAARPAHARSPVLRRRSQH